MELRLYFAISDSKSNATNWYWLSGASDFTYLSRLTHRAIAVGRKWNERPIHRTARELTVFA